MISVKRPGIFSQKKRKKKKKAVLDKFKEFKAMTEKQSGYSIKVGQIEVKNTPQMHLRTPAKNME